MSKFKGLNFYHSAYKIGIIYSKVNAQNNVPYDIVYNMYIILTKLYAFRNTQIYIDMAYASYFLILRQARLHTISILKIFGII